MESTLVIKVKYGDMLRRFNARVDENNQLYLDMVGLRAKILSLFNLPPDANFMLRYVDEDGDLVTLVDDDDLHDVMRQQLKFLRIDVHMMSRDNGSKSTARSSGSSTPLRSPRVPDPFLNGNAAVADVLKSVPEPIREALSNLSLDLASKTASSSPVLATLADCFSKMGQSLLNSDSQPQVAVGSSSKDGVPMTAVSFAEGGSQSVTLDQTSNIRQQVEARNVTRDMVAPVAPVDLNVPPCDLNPYQSTIVNTTAIPSAVSDGDVRKGKIVTDDGSSRKGDSSGAPTSHAAPGNSSTQNIGRGSSPYVECPFSGTHFIDSAPPSLGNHRVHPFKRSHSHTEAACGMFHKGVRCDGCGVYPITGPRFKSKVKENYDLCSICFNEMGNESDYIRMDHPVSVRAPRSFKGLYEHPAWVGPPTLPHIFRTGGMKHMRPKLDSRFILDVNVIDGTMMAPSTGFTKIWRMRNNGTIVWPKGTQLVWIGGDKFSDFRSVDLEIPVDGVHVDKELDIAVDFRAPQSPGRYISYWRMASPSGQKFGQRVWVLIQVDASLKEFFYDRSQGLNLNIPLVGSSLSGPEIVDINVQPILDDVFLQPHNPNVPTEPVKQMVDEQPGKEPENDLNINDTTLVGHGALPPVTSAAPTSVSYPIIDFSEIAPAVPFNPESSVVDAPSSSLGVDGNNPVEESLLKELEEMGFKQVDLNKEILRMNEYNLEQSVDDLCGVSEWDPMLEELREMGFCDNEVNKKLLMKNNGSIKRVVMDLINGEKN
ncbi:hypothetical protein L6164_014774 [Bauhinia variegata]|uniref:Uncharacterized protein n=1 Tax=Bauhinia variegata TaxID=167791 RepID=A0ACB9NJV3_BAUVA|nr:hypothetical protein L6164_014774 [Bauhinia variegata]